MLLLTIENLRLFVVHYPLVNLSVTLSFRLLFPVVKVRFAFHIPWISTAMAQCEGSVALDVSTQSVLHPHALGHLVEDLIKEVGLEPESITSEHQLRDVSTDPD